MRADRARLLAFTRAHWAIENKVHWVRDVTFDEDRCRVRKQAGAHVMATVRNLVISLLRLAGATNIAAALRECAWHPARAFRLLGLARAYRQSLPSSDESRLRAQSRAPTDLTSDSRRR